MCHKIFVRVLLIIILLTSCSSVSFEFAQEKDNVKNVEIVEVDDETVKSVLMEVDKEILNEIEEIECRHYFTPETSYREIVIRVNYVDGGYELIGEGLSGYYSASNESVYHYDYFDHDEFSDMMNKYLKEVGKVYK